MRNPQVLRLCIIYWSRFGFTDVIDEDKLKYERIKKKGYLRMHTNMGQLNIELHCDMVPKTCENFLLLCQKGYYNGTKFHRSIRNFMVSLFSHLSWKFNQSFHY